MGEEKALRRARSKLTKALEAKRESEAIELLVELQRHEPENPRWPHKRGELLRNQGHSVQAAQCFEKAVALYANQGFIARAVAMAKTVVELDPSRIAVLERIDPHAAQLLRTQRRGPRAARLDLEDRSVGQLPLAPANDTLLRSNPAPNRAPQPRRPPPPVPSEPPAARTAALTGLSMPPRARAQAPFGAPPGVPARPLSRQPVAISRQPPPVPLTAARPIVPADSSLRGQRAAPPPPPPQALSVPGPPPATLDRLSLPPLMMRHRPRGPGSAVPLDDLYARAVRAVPLLSADPSAASDETRLSSVPPALRSSEGASERELARRLLGPAAAQNHAPNAASEVAHALAADDEFDRALEGIEATEGDLAGALALSEAELTVRVPLPVLESDQPEPPSAATLADLPLFPLFAELPRAVLAQIVAGAQLIELRHGAHAVRKDDAGDALYGIVEGSVTVSVPGQAFELTLAEGDVFGEACMLEDAKSQVDVVVQGRLTALRIPRDVLLEGVQQHPPLAGLVLALLTRRLLGNLLQVSPLFQDFDAAGKAKLAALFEVGRVASGTQLAAVGKKMDGLYISLTGTLEVHQPGQPLRVAPPGSLFGHSGLLSQTPSRVEVLAGVDMIVLRLPFARFAGIAMQHPTVLARLAEHSTSDVVRVMM